MKAYALASLCVKQTSGEVTQRVAVHLREAISEEEAVGIVYKHLNSGLKPGWHVAQVVAMPVFKDESTPPDIPKERA